MTQFIPQQTQTSEYDTLNATETARFVALEAQIQDNLYGHRQVTAALLEIHDQRLYRAKYRTFESYLKMRWSALHGDVSRMQAWRMIEHERTLQAFEQEFVTTSLQISPPQSHAQTEALSKLEPQDRPTAFVLAQEATGKEQPSSSAIAAVVKDLQTTTTDERIGRLDTDRKAKPPPVVQTQYPRKSFRVSEFKFDNLAKKVYFQVFKPGNSFKGWEPKTEKLSISLDDLVWELRNIGFCIMPIGDPVPADAGADEEATEQPSAAPVALVPRLRLGDDNIPRDAGGKPMSEKLITYWQARGYFPDYVPNPDRDCKEEAEDDEPVSGPFWTPEPELQRDDFLATFFNDEDTPQ